MFLLQILETFFSLYSKRFHSRFHDFFKYSRCMHDKSRNREMKSKLDSPTRCSAISFNFLLLLSIPFFLSAKASTVLSFFFIVFLNSTKTSLSYLLCIEMEWTWNDNHRQGGKKASRIHSTSLVSVCSSLDENIICRVAQICSRLPSLGWHSMLAVILRKLRMKVRLLR